MSQGLVERQNLEDIADAIRSKNGSSDTYTPAEMAQAISGIHTADEVVLVQKTVNANGQYNASDDSADGYSGVSVNVPNSYAATDEGKVVSDGALVGQTSRNVTSNGTYDTTENNQVVVNVPGGSSSERIVDPVFQGLTYMYVNSMGEQIYTSNTKNQYLSIFEVQKSHTYVLFVGKTVSNRRRAGFFRLSMSDLEQYLDQYTASDTPVYSNGVWLAPYTQGSDDAGGYLIGRIIFDAPDDGVILFGTSNNGMTAPTYCIDIT